MPRVTFNRLTKKKASSKRKRTSNMTKTRYQAPTARNQRKQIMTNAMAIRQVKRMLPKPIYTDYQVTGRLQSLVIPGDDAFQLNSDFFSLTNPLNWTQVLRKDPNVLDAVSTRLLRIQLNLRYALNLSNRAQMSLFVVTFRKNAANRNPAILVDGDDYIRGGQEYVVRLNPAVMKVHYTRNVSLTAGAWEQLPAVAGGTTFAGNPYSTFKKGQCTMKLNFNIREPNGATWKSMIDDQLPHWQRYWLLVFFYQQGTGLSSGESAYLEFDSLATCYNSGI